MGRRVFKVFFLLSLLTLVAGCSAAGTDVKNLMSNLNFFKLNSSEIRIANLSELANITISASCSSATTGFKFDISNSTPESWLNAPTTPSGYFTSVDNKCSTLGTVTFVLDLSAISPFSTMAFNQTLLIKVQDENTFNVPATEVFRVVYAKHNLISLKNTYGSGRHNSVVSGSYSLKGRLIEISDTQATPDGSNSGSYSLKGKVVFQ